MGASHKLGKEIKAQAIAGLIPPEAFQPNEGVGLPFGKTSGFPTHASTPHVLHGACRTLDVSLYQLRNLLGLPGRNTVYQYVKGDRRPSALYLSRLAFLFVLKIDGRLNVSRVQRIDWVTGHITWRRGLEPAQLGPNQSVGGPAYSPTKAAAK